MPKISKLYKLSKFRYFSILKMLAASNRKKFSIICLLHQINAKKIFERLRNQQTIHNVEVCTEEKVWLLM